MGRDFAFFRPSRGSQVWSKAAWRWGFPPQSRTLSRQGWRNAILSGFGGGDGRQEDREIYLWYSRGSSAVSNKVELLLPENANPMVLNVAVKLDEFILALRR